MEADNVKKNWEGGWSSGRKKEGEMSKVEGKEGRSNRGAEE